MLLRYDLTCSGTLLWYFSCGEKYDLRLFCSANVLVLKIKTPEQIQRMRETCRVSKWVLGKLYYWEGVRFFWCLHNVSLACLWGGIVWNLFLTFFQIAREVLDAAARIIRPGITTDEIDAVVHDATIAAGTIFSLFLLPLRFVTIAPYLISRVLLLYTSGGYPSPLNYHFFPKSCCT